MINLRFTTAIAAALAASLTLSASSPGQAASPPAIISHLQIISVNGAAPPKTVYTRQGMMEAPNWTRDGSRLLFDGAGTIFSIPVAGGTPAVIDTGVGTRCGGSHGLSPDGSTLAISCTSPAMPGSRIYVMPLAGGTPRVVTQNAGAYWHSWSPDGQTIFFTRPDHGALNIYSIAIDGTGERAITSGTGISDDPDISPDGRYIYFNSDRGGTMQIWRMHPDGTQPEPITSDDRVNWTAHPSPDGKWIVFISYQHGTTGHPANMPVELHLMSLADRKIRVLTTLVGGSGTMNVPSWSPDSKQLAFVSYEVGIAQ